MMSNHTLTTGDLQVTDRSGLEDSDRLDGKRKKSKPPLDSSVQDEEREFRRWTRAWIKAHGGGDSCNDCLL
jgi:hypothetical protein